MCCLVHPMDVFVVPVGTSLALSPMLKVAARAEPAGAPRSGRQGWMRRSGKKLAAAARTASCADDRGNSVLKVVTWPRVKKTLRRALIRGERRMPGGIRIRGRSSGDVFVWARRARRCALS